MTIAVDAGALGITDKRLRMGVFWVNVNLLRQLGKLDRKNSYILYSFAPIDPKLMQSFGPRMKNVVLRPPIGWFVWRLPLELALHTPDVYLGLSQAVPQTRARSIGFIYDLGFLHHPEAYPGSQEKLVSITDNLVKRAEKIIAISQVVKDDIVSRYEISSSNITVAYPGVAKSFTPPGPKHRGRRPYFLFVGALKRGKNIPGLLAGFAKFQKSSGKLYDLYLGGGDYWRDPEIHKQIEQLGLGVRVHQLGFVPEDKLASYYRGAVAFVAPSLYEGFCLPVVEAMASGTPVIASTAGALPEIVGDAGILVSPTDDDALARAMKTMADENKRVPYVAKGLAQAKKFRWETFASTVLGVIHK
jgi:glycosyltransferase involved in cell wall biosynthesis